MTAFSRGGLGSILGGILFFCLFAFGCAWPFSVPPAARAGEDVAAGGGGGKGMPRFVRDVPAGPGAGTGSGAAAAGASRHIPSAAPRGHLRGYLLSSRAPICA